MSIYKFFAPQCSLFGYGSLLGIADEIISHSYKKALIVTDPSLIQLGMVDKITDVLHSIHMPYVIFDGVKSNPTVRNVNDGLQKLKKEQCDYLISLGGGSAHDCAKAISIVATNGGSILDYKGMDQSKVMPLPLIAVNTTAGTASETTRAFVIVNEKTEEKFGSRDRNVIPVVAVDDHELMMNLPKGLTAGTGMDALTHAIEAYTSIHGYLITSELALSAIRLIFKNLEKAVLDPDEGSREGMAAGQYLAGLAFGNAGCGLVHAMSHQLSAIYDLPHGLCNAILLPVVCRYNCEDKTAMSKYAQLAENIFPLDTQSKSIEEKADYFISRVESLSEIIGTRQSLSSLGVKKKDIFFLAEKTLLDGSLSHNPMQPDKIKVGELFESLMQEEAR